MYTSGIFDDKNCDKDNVDQALTAVGYGTDTTSGLDYYIVRNNWGA